MSEDPASMLCLLSDMWGYLCELQSTTSFISVQLYMSSMCGELSIWHSPWPCMADLFLISTAVSCTCMSFTLLVENTMAELGEDDVLSDEVRTDSWKPPWLFMISRPLPYFMCTTTETLPPKPPWALMFLALSLAAACLQPHQVQLGLRGEGALQEMLYWPPGVGEDRFLSCMVLPTVEVLMSLCTLAQVNNMATRDMSDRSVLHEMAPAELTSLQLFSSSTELSTSSAVLSSSLSMSTTPKPKIMKGAKATGLNLLRLLNLQVLFAMRSYPMDMGFLMLVMVRMMTLDLLQLLFDVPWT